MQMTHSHMAKFTVRRVRVGAHSRNESVYFYFKGFKFLDHKSVCFYLQSSRPNPSLFKSIMHFSEQDFKMSFPNHQRGQCRTFDTDAGFSPAPTIAVRVSENFSAYPLLRPVRCWEVLWAKYLSCDIFTQNVVLSSERRHMFWAGHENISRLLIGKLWCAH